MLMYQLTHVRANGMSSTKQKLQNPLLYHLSEQLRFSN